jgi:hypothetical protein
MDQSTVRMTEDRSDPVLARDHREPAGDKSPQEIEEDIARTRVRLSATIEAIERRLAPTRVAEVLRDSLEPPQGPFRAHFRNYAIPLALILAGLGWLFVLRRSMWRAELPSDFGEMPAEAVELGETPLPASAYLEPEEPVTLVDRKI